MKPKTTIIIATYIGTVTSAKEMVDKLKAAATKQAKGKRK